MLRSRRTTLLLPAAVFVAAWFAWRAYDLFAMPFVAPHVGEGQFQNHSWRFPHRDYGLPLPGYTIDFEKFDLGQPFEATYEVARLPLAGNRVGVYLSVVDPGKKFEQLESRKRLIATIEISIIDGYDKIACKVNEPLARLVWAGDEGGA